MTTQQDLTEDRHPSETEPAAPPPKEPSEPIASEPIASKPIASKPIASKPVASEPVASKPVASEPGTGSAKTGLDSTESDRASDPAASEADQPTATDSAGDEATPSGGAESSAGAETSDGAEKADGGAAAGDGAAARRVRVTRARVMGALAAMLVAALAATAVLQWVSANQAHDALARLESERALRLEVSGAASSFGQSLLSYDYQDLQTTRSTLMAQATGDFLTTYDEAFGGAMAQVIVKLKAVSRATVREVYLSDVDEATAHAIVVVDQQVNTAEAIRSVTGSHLKVTLVKEKGVWKVQEVTVLGAAKEDQYNLDGTRADAKKKD